MVRSSAAVGGEDVVTSLLGVSTGERYDMLSLGVEIATAPEVSAPRLVPCPLELE